MARLGGLRTILLVVVASILVAAAASQQDGIHVLSLPYGSLSNALAAGPNRVVFVTNTSPAKLVQVSAAPFGEQKSEFTLSATKVLDLPLDYVLYAACKIPSNNANYPAVGLFASFTMPAKVAVVDLEKMQVIGHMIIPSKDGAQIRSAVCHSEFAVLGSFSDPARLIKISYTFPQTGGMVDLKFDGSVSLGLKGVANVAACAAIPEQDLSIWALFTTPAKLIKVKSSTLEQLQMVILPSEVHKVLSMSADAENLYIGTGAGFIVIVRHSSMEVLGKIQSIIAPDDDSQDLMSSSLVSSMIINDDPEMSPEGTNVLFGTATPDGSILDTIFHLRVYDQMLFQVEMSKIQNAIEEGDAGLPTGFYAGALLDTPYTREGINIALFGQFGAPYYLVPVEIEIIERAVDSKGFNSFGEKDVIQTTENSTMAGLVGRSLFLNITRLPPGINSYESWLSSSDDSDSEDIAGDPVVVYLRVEELKDDHSSAPKDSDGGAEANSKDSDVDGLGIALKRLSFEGGPERHSVELKCNKHGVFAVKYIVKRSSGDESAGDDDGLDGLSVNEDEIDGYEDDFYYGDEEEYDDAYYDEIYKYMPEFGDEAEMYSFQDMHSEANLDLISEEYAHELTQALKDTNFDFSQIHSGGQDSLTPQMLQDPNIVAKIVRHMDRVVGQGMQYGKNNRMKKKSNKKKNLSSGAGEIPRAPAATLVKCHHDILGEEFRFSKFGVGGLDSELKDLSRRVLLPHMLPQVAKRLAIEKSRGVLLYGPPGCGKTTIAKALGKLLHARKPRIVNGPEVVSKYLGESEAKMRELFDFGPSADDGLVNLVILDELDALVRPRGRGRGDAADSVYDGITNTLLAMMDGMDGFDNVIVIGTTNRLDLIDTALLRPGRFDLQLEVSLPTREGRRDILDIHMRTMAERGHVAKDVNIDKISEMAEGFTGAELEGVVKAGASFALERALGSGIEQLLVDEARDDSSALLLTMADLTKGLGEIEPAHQNPEDQLQELMQYGIIAFSDHFLRIQNNMDMIGSSISSACKSKDTEHTKNSLARITSPQKQIHRLLINGPPGSGKTALAAWFLSQSGVSHKRLRIITPGDLLGQTADEKLSELEGAFQGLCKPPRGELSAILLDDLDLIVEAAVHVRYGATWNAAVTNSLISLLKDIEIAKPGCCALVVATAEHEFMSGFEAIGHSFDAAVTLALIDNPRDIKKILSTSTSSFASEIELEKAVAGLSGAGSAHPIKLILKALSLSSRFGSVSEGAGASGILAKDFLAAYDSMKAAYMLSNSVQLGEGDFITYGATSNDSSSDGDEDGSWWIW